MREVEVCGIRQHQSWRVVARSREGQRIQRPEQTKLWANNPLANAHLYVQQREGATASLALTGIRGPASGARSPQGRSFLRRFDSPH